jgi:hypothetical protein
MIDSDEILPIPNAVFWDVKSYVFIKNRCFGGTSVLARATRRNNPEGGILHSHRR